MSTPEAIPEVEPKYTIPPDVYPHVDDLVIEDGAPVDGILSERQMEILTSSLYASWPGPGDGRTFAAFHNVGLFYAAKQPPYVPDTMVSLDIQIDPNLGEKENNSYFVWIFGKFPEVVVEIVSNREGKEDDEKLAAYNRFGILNYIIFDPFNLLKGGPIRVYVKRGKKYHLEASNWVESLGLGLKQSPSVHRGAEYNWLRWCDDHGNILPTPQERASVEKQRADAEKQRADALAAKLRALGVDPDA